MRPSPDSGRRILVTRWGVFAAVLLAGIVAFFVWAHEIAPLTRAAAP